MNEKQIRYSIIVPAYQEAAKIAECVGSVATQTVDRSEYEIIVVDDASTDGTAAAAKAAGADRVLTIEHGGPSAARNAGLAVASGDIVLFTDADCVAARDWLETMLQPLAEPATVGVKGVYRTRQTALIPRLVQLEFEMRYERMAVLSEIDFIDTYAAAYRREILKEEGGFSTDYPVASAEDVDLSFRLACKGYRLVFAPHASVWHTHPASLWSYLKRKMRFGYWRALLYTRYPDKRGGDAHTDPALKSQFELVAMAGLLGIGGFFWKPFWFGVALLLLAFLLTTLRFVRWAWHRDRAVALVWPLVTFLRVILQGIGLGAGLIAHQLR